MRINDLTDIDLDQLRAELDEAQLRMEACVASGVDATVWMEAAFAGADVVLAYWPTPNYPGSERALVKGEGVVKLVKGPEVMRILRIEVQDEAAALAMSKAWGDDRPKGPKPATTRQQRRAAARKAS